ncbi:RagB/SusD family nutrient uptake outer membrane protein [Pedobacter frigoris]|uniref:RagB/SusD family nutrient uptake outer membrane protein n=1 Tax=Pedobacter frigoris TaxID=2571272 RepID=A0A4U1CDS2_9SPHI|nr:RagB/SusD family nutrient uptake outer membrane protein [Pedobacter frigoris]TKC04441.1 RagB/SusD family nutrient uptake outer membrane protein [Pedobacter frigoris]
MRLKIHNYTLLLLTLMLLAACSEKLDLRPETSMDTDKALTGEANLRLATSGNYSLLNYFDYVSAYFHLTESPVDNVEATSVFDPGGTRQYGAYSYIHFPTMSNSSGVYSNAYKLIRGVNNVIAAIPDDASPALLQLKGENLFLRAFAYQTLVKVFGRPYLQGNGNNPGVVILDKPTPSLERPAKRNTVKEVYDFIVADLLKAEGLMTIDNNNAFASKYTAQAMLSSLHLNMGNNAKSIEYADKIIGMTSKFTLAQGDAYKSYFSTNHSADKETIFCIKNLDGTGGGFYYYNQSYTVEKFAAVSPPLWNLLNEGTGDLRKNFYKALKTADGTTWNFTTKLIQNPAANPTEKVSSPAIYRLAEMYLNRAEANAKLNNGQLALDDVNTIRRRAGLTGVDLYATDNLRGRSSILQVVLDERRLEFAFEGGQRRDDLLRNNLPMIRTYGKAGQPGSNISVQPTDLRVVYFIPLNETNGVTNTLDQNP